MGREATAVLSTLLALGILAVVPRLVRLMEKPEPLLKPDGDGSKDKPKPGAASFRGNLRNSAKPRFHLHSER